MIRWPTVHLLRGRARAGRETLRGGRMQRCTTRHTGEGQAGWDLGPTAHVRKQPRPDVPAQVNFMHSFGAQSRNLVGKRWSVHLTFSQRFGFLPAICKPVRSHHNSTQQHAITIVRHATPQSQGTCAHPSSSSESLMSSPIGFSSTG